MSPVLADRRLNILQATDLFDHPAAHPFFRPQEDILFAREVAVEGPTREAEDSVHSRRLVVPRGTSHGQARVLPGRTGLEFRRWR
jgi:hypothetical protein